MEAAHSTAYPSSDYVLVPRSAVEELLASFSQVHPSSRPFDPDAMLSEFEQACRIDYLLRPATIREHLRHVKRLWRFLDKHPLDATRHDLRHFLTLDPANNAIKAIRVLYGKFLNSDLAKSFKVPQSGPRVIIAPTREQIRQTYDNLDTPELRAAFLLLATSGLRRHELMELTSTQIDLERRLIYPNRDSSRTKLQWVTCFNDEAKVALQELLRVNGMYVCMYNMDNIDNTHVFTIHPDTLTRKLKRASGGEITPQTLRDWFCCEMGKLNVPDRYIDAFCGRVPSSVLARHYTDYSPERLKEIYDHADLKVFGARVREREWR